MSLAARPAVPRALAGLAALALSTGCAVRAARPVPAPLAGEGMVLVYLAPAPDGARRLAFSIDAVAALGAGGAVPLERHTQRLDLAAEPRQHLLATGRLAPGDYEGLALRLSRGVLGGASGPPADLVTPEGPIPASGHFEVQAGRVTALTVQVSTPEETEVFRLAPAFAVAAAARPTPSLAALAVGPGLLVQLDRRTLRVGAADPVSRDPSGVAVDAARGVAYVTEAEADTVAVLDVASGDRLREIRLLPGDRPGAIALTPDGATAVVIARGPEAAVFVDTQSAVEVGRAAVGQDPRALLVDRQGRFAYAANRASDGVTVLDVANRSAAATLATDPAPVGVALGRAGDVLYVAHAGSAYLAAFRLPDRTGAGRLYVGLGASAVQVDAKTGLIALASGDDRSIRIFAPGQQTPLAEIALPGAATRLLVDDVEQTLLALVPEARRILAVDLATRRVRAEAELPETPLDLAVSGERR